VRRLFKFLKEFIWFRKVKLNEQEKEIIEILINIDTDFEIQKYGSISRYSDNSNNNLLKDDFKKMSNLVSKNKKKFTLEKSKDKCNDIDSLIYKDE
jgi:hypothetical protein